MKIIVWNCRGLGNGPAVRGLLNLQKEKDPDILFLSETKMDRNRIQGFRWKLGMTNMVVKDCEGKSGGLVFWKKDINLHLCTVSRLYIDVDVVEKDGFIWRFTGMYGKPRSDQKDRTWRALHTLNAARRRLWLCMGDFYEILMCCEKEGGQPRSQSCMDKFRDALDHCALSDLGFVGDTFTWRNNSHKSENYIRERLDRAVADIDWRSCFPDYKVVNGDHNHSDHRPVIVTINEDVVTGSSGNGPKTFRFEAGWVKEENCAAIVENAWKLAMEVRGEKVKEAVREVAGDLWDWSRNILGDLEKRIKWARKALELCRRGTISYRTVAREEILKYKLEKLEEHKDMYWRQRAHVHWLEEGDRNTKFFHNYASERRRRNKIEKLVRDDEMEVTELEGMKELITDYYNSLFEAQIGNRYEELLTHVTPRVSEDMNACLTCAFTDKEIKVALAAIGDLKAPGADGMPALFYK